jgi:hypothetical protein
MDARVKPARDERRQSHLFDRWRDDAMPTKMQRAPAMTI